jgi:hypothetical protein
MNMRARRPFVEERARNGKQKDAAGTRVGGVSTSEHKHVIAPPLCQRPPSSPAESKQALPCFGPHARHLSFSGALATTNIAARAEPRSASPRVDFHARTRAASPNGPP